jgi:hypothetical protein
MPNSDYRVTDVPLRGFWSYYAGLPLSVERVRCGADRSGAIAGSGEDDTEGTSQDQAHAHARTKARRDTFTTSDGMDMTGLGAYSGWQFSAP